MTFLPIVVRELRVASRRRATYWLRFFLALAVLVIWFFLLVAGRNSAAQRGQMLFMSIGILALGFCLLAGVFLTADCLSEEKREGTLGLLFLTELKGYDVVLGKLMATSLHAFYGLLAVLPLLALPLLIGGVTAGEFWRTTLVLVATLFLSLSLGLVVSAASRDTRQAMAGTLLALIVLSGILPVLWWLQHLFGKGQAWDSLLWPSPAYLYYRAFDAYYGFRAGAQEFWSSWLVIALLGWGCLLLASALLPGAWQEKKGAAVSGERLSWPHRLRFGNATFRRRRLRLLEENPFYWLASRDRLPRWSAGWVLGLLLVIWAGFLAGCFSASRAKKDISFGVVMFLAYGIHQLLKYFMALDSSRRLSNDHHSGALELLLVTPISVKEILDGQRRALRELFRGPMVLVWLTNAGLFWLVVVRNPMGMSLDDVAPFCEIYLGGAVMLLVDFYALSWIGMGMALRTRRHHRAIFATLARVMLPPWLAILFMVFLGMAGMGMSRDEVMTLTALWFFFGFFLDFIQAIAAKNKLLQEMRHR